MRQIPHPRTLLCLVLGISTLGGVALTATPAVAGAIDAYAPPGAFGRWHVVGSHSGPVTYHIKAAQLGNVPTLLTGQVLYWDDQHRQVTRTFFDSATVTTGNSFGNVYVRFKGNPTGTFVRVTTVP